MYKLASCLPGLATATTARENHSTSCFLNLLQVFLLLYKKGHRYACISQSHLLYEMFRYGLPRSRRTLCRWVKQLEALGYIRTTRRHIQDNQGHWRSLLNSYTITLAGMEYLKGSFQRLSAGLRNFFNRCAKFVTKKTYKTLYKKKETIFKDESPIENPPKYSFRGKTANIGPEAAKFFSFVKEI